MPQRHITKSHARILIATAVAAAAASSFGEGFRNPPAGAYSLGRAGARFAQNDDPSTAYHNPANIVEIEGTSMSIAPSAVYISIKRADGIETTDPLKILPNFFATRKINDKLSLGLAIVAPYGLSNEWDQEKGGFADTSTPFSLRYQAPWFTEMKTVDINPSVAYKIRDNLSVGVGLNVHWSELTFKRYFPWQFVTGTAEGAMKARGDGFGFGGNAGITWEIVEGHRLAATFRTPVEVDYDGYVEIGNFPAGFPVGSARSHFGTRIETPTIVGVGYGVQLTDAIQLEANAEWLEFSNFENLIIDTGANNPLVNGGSAGPIVQAQNWDDTFTVGIGGSWQMCSEWRLNASYQYYESPVPNAFFTTTIPDGDQNVFTVGLQWKRGKHALEFAYGGIFYDERNIARTDAPNTVYNGKYDITVHLFALSYTFAF